MWSLLAAALHLWASHSSLHWLHTRFSVAVPVPFQSPAPKFSRNSKASHISAPIFCKLDLQTAGRHATDSVFAAGNGYNMVEAQSTESFEQGWPHVSPRPSPVISPGKLVAHADPPWERPENKGSPECP
jgi:hypothetical protein